MVYREPWGIERYGESIEMERYYREQQHREYLYRKELAEIRETQIQKEKNNILLLL